MPRIIQDEMQWALYHLSDRPIYYNVFSLNNCKYKQTNKKMRGIGVSAQALFLPKHQTLQIVFSISVMLRWQSGVKCHKI